MPDSVVPDPEFQPRDELAAIRDSRFVEEYVSRSEREAAAILDRHTDRTPAGLQNIVALAWATGFMAGYGKALDRVNEAYEKVRQVYGE